jgi:hypothetical protein
MTAIETLDTSRVVGGSSVHPFVQNILLGVREQGFGMTPTTVVAPVEAKVKGTVEHPARILRRGPHDRRLARKAAADPTQPSVEQVATVDSFGGAPLRSDA